MMKEKAIVFDFDGPLVGSGQDKAIHILFSSFVACWETSFRVFFHPEKLEIDLERMLKGLVKYPGAPRFQQLSAIVSCIVRDIDEAVKDPTELGIDQNLQKEYEKLKQIYNNFYSSLNDAAAKLYWKPLEGVKDVIEKLAKEYDLYVASGIVQEILEKDFEHHGFEKRFFSGIFGSNKQGDIDKANILKKIKCRGYKDVLFIGDSRKDFEYAQEAGVKFYRVKTGHDYKNFLREIKNGLPTQIYVCEFTDREINRIRSKVLALMKLYASGKRPSFKQVTTFVNTTDFKELHP
ncbi:MAG: HAD hydrolase-like protein [Candidatus Omnitrophica bacterium]|nr:HAD hydrolase-like protein [Candidatus Omnitrophota bacterium]